MSSIYDTSDILEDEAWIDTLKGLGGEPSHRSGVEEPVAEAALLNIDLQEFMEATLAKTAQVEATVAAADRVRCELGAALDRLVDAAKRGDDHLIEFYYVQAADALSKAFRLEALPSYAVADLRQRMIASGVATHQLGL